MSNRVHINKQKMVPTYKVVLVGDGGVGKTAMCRALRTGEFYRPYVATLGVEVHTVTFATNYGPIQLNFWDTAGQEKYSGLKDGYYIKANAAILMYDAGSRLSYRNIPQWHASIKRTCGDIPMVLCGNKSDLDTIKVDLDEDDVREIEEQGVKFFSTSVKNDSRAMVPMVEHLLRRLTNLADLKILA